MEQTLGKEDIRRVHAGDAGERGTDGRIEVRGVNAWTKRRRPPICYRMPLKRMGALPLSVRRNGRHEETRTPDLYRVKVAL